MSCRFASLRSLAADGALVGAAHLEVFRVEEVEAWQRLEPVAPDGLLGTAEHTVLAVEVHLAAEVARGGKCLAGMCHRLLAVADAVGGTCIEGMHEGAVVGSLCQGQCLVEHLHGLSHLSVPFHGITAILHGQGTEEVAGEHEGIGLDAEQVEALGIGGGGIGLCHCRQTVVGHLAQCPHVALQVGDVSIGIEQLRHVEHLA